jgi:hypothetical protein
VDATDFTQDQHFMSIETPLGKDHLLPDVAGRR